MRINIRIRESVETEGTKIRETKGRLRHRDVLHFVMNSLRLVCAIISRQKTGIRWCAIKFAGKINASRSRHEYPSHILSGIL